jgi:hypothetical protein
MNLHRKNKNLLFFALVTCVFATACKENTKPKNQYSKEKEFQRVEKHAIDSLKVHGLYNYLDSAYLYTYVYFGGLAIKRCGTVNIDSVLPSVNSRRLVYQDLVLRRVRIMKDSSLVFLSLSPLIRDSILSCDMLAGPQLPHEVMFNYKEKRFVQFVYDESSFLRVSANPLADYNENLKKIIDSDRLTPNRKFKELLSKLNPN